METKHTRYSNVSYIEVLPVYSQLLIIRAKHITLRLSYGCLFWNYFARGD